MRGNTFRCSTRLYTRILGTTLFNILLSDSLLVINDTNFCSYADDNTTYDSLNSIGDVISSLKESVEKLFQWFCQNQMKENKGKCHLIVSSG